MIVPNLDSVFYSVKIKDYQENMLSILIDLEKKQLEAKEKNKNITISIGDENFELLPNGARTFKYILHNNRYEIKLAQFYSSSSSNFPIFIRLKSEFLWEQRFSAYVRNLKFIEDNFGEVLAVKLSRIDMCCHVDLIDMNKIELKRFVTRSKWKEVHKEDSLKSEEYYTGKNLTGLSLGKTPIRFRIYDKSLEIVQSSKKTWFYVLWMKNNVKDVDSVVNVEFQLNRKFFKEFGIDTFDDFNRRINTIWEYLTSKWLRYVNIDHARLEECTTNSTWKKIQDAYNKDWKAFEGIERVKQKKANADMLLNMIKHYSINHAAAISTKNEMYDDFDNYIGVLYEELKYLMKYDDLDFAEEVKNKMLMG